MQLAKFRVDDLFGIYNHEIPFVTTGEDTNDVSVVIVHGYNGVGKTTTLQMIAGILKLDFSAFRKVPFSKAVLTFSTGESLTVISEGGESLRVEFGDLSVQLHPERPGAKNEKDEDAVSRFRETFFEATKSITFTFLPDARSMRESETENGRRREYELLHGVRLRDDYPRQQEQVLANQVRDFVRNAQLDSPAFFKSNGPDMFQRIIDDLTTSTDEPVSRGQVEEQLKQIHLLETTQSRFGLTIDDWDFDRLVSLLQGEDERTLTVIATYAEFLLARAESRQFLADRLATFEEVMTDFLRDKQISVHVRRGLEITTKTGAQLEEHQLSSGEYQLLYLMVAALTTRRRGTVIAIDEPELSMHIAWQRKLVPSLIRCASRAAPQLVLATHSPDIAAGYRENLVRIGGSVDVAEALA